MTMGPEYMPGDTEDMQPAQRVVQYIDAVIASMPGATRHSWARDNFITASNLSNWASDGKPYELDMPQVQKVADALGLTVVDVLRIEGHDLPGGEKPPLPVLPVTLEQAIEDDGGLDESGKEAMRVVLRTLRGSRPRRGSRVSRDIP